MEGELWKWTNYWNGWQSRWFILEDGVLSYFKSYDEVSLGCKGSISLNVCEIVVHSNDQTRLDLNVSNEQYLYLKANSEKERQQWLIALGSAKANQANRQRRQRISSTTSSSFGDSPNQAIPQLNRSNSTNSIEDTQALKSKKTELRLYCDLLMQEIHKVKTIGNRENDTSTTSSNGGDELDETMVKATCDTFIQTLDELMELADQQYHIYGNHRDRSSRERSSTPSSIGGSVSTQSSKFRRGSESTTNHIARNSSPPIAESEESESETNKNVVENFKSENTRTEFEPYDDNNIIGTSSAAVSKSSKNKPENREDDIYFPFKKSYPKPTSENPEIDVSELVYASREILKVYDFLGKVTFSPIKTEVKGLVRSIETKHSSNIDAFETVTNILRDEIFAKTASRPNSATSAFKWLVRHWMFLHYFLHIFVESQKPTKDCLKEAYENSLLKYHDQVIQSVFAVAIQSAPSRYEFIQAFRITTDFEQNFKLKVVPKLAEYLESLDCCLTALKSILEKVESKK